MRVLTVGNGPPDPGAGGLEVVWADLIDGLRAAGHEVEVLHPPAIPGLWREGRWLRMGPLRAWSVDRRARAVLRDNLAGADVVVWITLGGLSMSLLGEAARVGVPQVGLIHDAWMLYGPRQDAWHRLRRRALRPPPDVLWCANSAFTRDGTVAEVPLARVEVISPGVDQERFAPAPPQDWAGRLVHVGRLGPEKGVRHAVEALAALPVATLTVHGPPHAAEEAELRRLADSLGVGRRLILGGPLPRDRVRDAYAAADAVVFPVVWNEPWGLVPLEAMAVGRPVIATGTGGSREYLRDEHNCLLVPRFDGPAIAAAAARLATDTALRERLVAGGRATVAERRQHTFVARQVAAIERHAQAPRRATPR